MAGPLRRPAEPQKPRSFGAPASRKTRSESSAERSSSSTEHSTARSNEPGRDRARFSCRERNYEQVQVAEQGAEQGAEAEPGVMLVLGVRILRGLALIAVLSGKGMMLFRVLMFQAVAVIA